MPDSHSVPGPCRKPGSSCFSRRQFVVGGGAGAAAMLLGQIFPGRVLPQDERREAQVARFPRVHVAKYSQLKTDQPLDFEYPNAGLHTSCFLVKLGRRAGGGIGPEQDIVAFSKICTHMGGDLFYNAEYKLAGPCGEHLTSFDIVRHGMVAAGHATEALPQIILDLEDEAIFATGILGLLYGYHTNPTGENRGD